MTLDPELTHYWNVPPAELLARLHTNAEGLTTPEARRRLATCGPNALVVTGHDAALRLFLEQFQDPLLLILAVAEGVSPVVREWVDAGIVLVLIIGGAVLGLIQEYSA